MVGRMRKNAYVVVEEVVVVVVARFRVDVS